MNCKPGDLAYIVGSVYAENNGRIVSVLSASAAEPQCADVWNIECRTPLSVRNRGGKTVQRLAATCPDKLLRPIRDPGDDAVDQTLNWLSVPESEAA